MLLQTIIGLTYELPLAVGDEGAAVALVVSRLEVHLAGGVRVAQELQTSKGGST